MQTNSQNSTVLLPDGRCMPRLGQGTWYMGDSAATRQQEIEALRHGIRLGLTLIDTAEMYGSGKSEQLVGEAIAPFAREELFLVSKVYPHNAGRPNIFHSCKESLARMGTDYLDLYLLHWRGQVPLAETVACMEELMAQGLIRGWGVSNFDTADMQELWRTKGGDKCAVNQVLYHLGSRGIEFDLLPWLKEHGVPAMAYCPLAQGGSLKNALLRSPAVVQTAQKHGITPIQVLLCFVLQNHNVIAIPKASKAEHTAQNAQALSVTLDEADLKALSQAFPAPTRKTYLDIV